MVESEEKEVQKQGKMLAEGDEVWDGVEIFTISVRARQNPEVGEAERELREGQDEPHPHDYIKEYWDIPLKENFEELTSYVSFKVPTTKKTLGSGLGSISIGVWNGPYTP